MEGRLFPGATLTPPAESPARGGLERPSAPVEEEHLRRPWAAWRVRSATWRSAWSLSVYCSFSGSEQLREASSPWKACFLPQETVVGMGKSQDGPEKAQPSTHPASVWTVWIPELGPASRGPVRTQDVSCTTHDPRQVDRGTGTSLLPLELPCKPRSPDHPCWCGLELIRSAGLGLHPAYESEPRV